MNLGFVGKGKVALSFAAFFEKAGHRIVGFHTKSSPNPDIMDKCDIVFIATPDDVIVSAAAELQSKAKVLCHFSGALPSGILAPFAGEGGTAASLHPVMTFAQPMDLRDVPCAYEGSGGWSGGFLDFLKGTGLTVFTIEPGKKPLYHAAMCNVSNHITTMIYMTQKMLKGSGIYDMEILDIISPLIYAAVDNTIKLGPEKALTGPVARGDIKTIEAQTEFTDCVYNTLAAKTADLAFESKKIDKNTADTIKDILLRKKRGDF